MIVGSLVALITPMKTQGEIDWESLEKLVAFHLDNDTDGIVSVGTSGESATLNMDEQIEVIRRTLEFADGQIPVIAGTGANSTAEALELTERAAKLGVAACLLVVPYYNKPTQHGLYEHFAHIATSVDIPQILYNVPSRTALDMTNDTIVRLSEIPNIIGIKDATGDIARLSDLVARCGDDFALYSGDDATTLEFLKAGGHGCISVTANVAPRKMQEMCWAVLDGRDGDNGLNMNRDAGGGDGMVLATNTNEILKGLHTALFLESNPIPAKWAVAELGLADEGIRLPLTWLSEEYHGVVKTAMKKAGVV